MFRVLEGLIHNINTPLNVILGYSQQLKKQHPELNGLDYITQAGIQIDDLVQSLSRQLAQRFTAEEEVFDLRQWVQDEMLLLRNILEIKHSMHFQVSIPETELPVKSSPLMLSVFIESLMLHIRSCPEIKTGNNSFEIKVQDNGDTASLSIRIPHSEMLRQELPAFLEDLLNRTTATFLPDAYPKQALNLSYDGNQEISISFPCRR